MGRLSSASRLWGLRRILQNTEDAILSCRMVPIAGMATKSGEGDGNKWRKWVEGKLPDSKRPSPKDSSSPSSAGAAAAASSTPAAPSSAVDDFERYVLGKTGDEEEGDDRDFHDIRESVQEAAGAGSEPGEPEDDFLQELTKIEKGDSWGKKDRRKDDLMMKRGYDDDKVPFDDEVDPENDESLLDQEDVVTYCEELQQFVTPKGLLNLPGMGREDNGKPYQLRPDKIYFPGQTIEPEDYDMTRLPTSDPSDGPPKTKKVLRKKEVLAAADFRNVKFLSLFLSETSRILPRRTTCVSKKAQRKIGREIKTARALGLLPFSSMGDPPFRYLKNQPAKDIDPEDEYDEDREEGGGAPRFRRRMF